jgi:hypothetical protein
MASDGPSVADSSLVVELISVRIGCLDPSIQLHSEAQRIEVHIDVWAAVFGLT